MVFARKSVTGKARAVTLLTGVVGKRGKAALVSHEPAALTKTKTKLNATKTLRKWMLCTELKTPSLKVASGT
jgi:hypothetical protein